MKPRSCAHWRALITRLRVADTVLSMFEDYRRKHAENQPKVGASPEKRLAKLERDEQATELNLNDGDLLADREKNKKLLALRAEKAVVKREIEQAAKIAPMPSRAAVEEYCAALADALDWDRADRLGFIERTVTQLTYADGEFAVEGRIALAGNAIKSRVQNRYKCLRSDPVRQGHHGGWSKCRSPLQHSARVLQIPPDGSHSAFFVRVSPGIRSCVRIWPHYRRIRRRMVADDSMKEWEDASKSPDWACSCGCSRERTGAGHGPC
jgi:hypothetical protein